MSTRLTHLTVAVLATTLVACYHPSPVPIQGAPSDIAQLRGSWDGEYTSVESGRSGMITFKIEKGKDTAFGDVVMTPAHENPLIAADADQRIHREHGPSSEWLRVTMIRVDGGLIRGELEPYIAPDCRCAVTTIFRGQLTGDRIEGTYVTRGPQNLMQEGKWWADRRPRMISSR